MRLDTWLGGHKSSDLSVLLIPVVKAKINLYVCLTCMHVSDIYAYASKLLLKIY